MSRHREIQVVCERVAGNRRNSVSCEYEIGKEHEVTLHANIWRTNSEGREVYSPADHDGRVFGSIEECDEFKMVHGYTRRFLTNPRVRANRVADTVTNTELARVRPGSRRAS